MDQVETTQTQCRHHWMIDTAYGPVSQGVCKLCGDAREFRNSVDEGYWEDDVNLQQLTIENGYPTEGPSNKQGPVEED